MKPRAGSGLHSRLCARARRGMRARRARPGSGRHRYYLGGQQLPIRAPGFLAVLLVLAALLSKVSELELKDHDGSKVVPTKTAQRVWGAMVGRGQ